MMDGTYVGQNIKTSGFTAQVGYDPSDDADEVIINILCCCLIKRYSISQINEYAGDAVYDWYDEVDFPGFNKKDINPFQ